jgi:hypothetical protein
MQYTFQGFAITYDGKSIVTVSKSCLGSDMVAFQAQVDNAYDIVACFSRSKPGSTWGCDGVGLYAQAQRGLVEVHKSGVGPRKFREGFIALTGYAPA